MNRQVGLIYVLGTALLAASACTNSSDQQNVPETNNGADINEISSGAVLPPNVSSWAVPVTGTIPFSADAQNLLAARLRDLEDRTDGTNNEGGSPTLYSVRAADLAALQRSLSDQGLQHGWTIVPTPQANPVPKGLADPLAGSWGMVWRSTNGEAVLVAGLDAAQANEAGDIPVLIDRSN